MAAILTATWMLTACASPDQPVQNFDLDAAARRLDMLTVDIRGHLDELRASTLINYHRLEGGMHACMRDHGQPYVQPAYVDFYRDFTDADLGYGTGGATILDSLTELGHRHILNEIAFARIPETPDPSSHGVAAADTSAWVAIFNSCAGPNGHAGYYSVEPPGGWQAASGLDELASQLGRHALVQAASRGYAGCMRDRYGYDVDWDTRGDFLFRDYGLQRAEAPAEGRPASPAWRAGEQRMLAVFGADADCRTPTYRVAMRLFAQRVDAWEAANRAQLTAIRAGWRQRVTDAGTLPKL